MKRLRVLLSASVLAAAAAFSVQASSQPGYCRNNPPPSCFTPTPRPSLVVTPAPTLAPTPAPTAAPTPAPAGWREVFYEPFDAALAEGQFPSAVASRWQSYLGPDSWSGSQYDGTRVVSWHDGYMDYRLHVENGTTYTAAAQPILDSSGAAAGKYQTYGRYEARWRVDSVAGFYWVPLLWPRSDLYLAEGEVDWPEGALTGTIHGFIHHTGSTTGGDQKACTTAVAMAGAFHVTVAEWRPGSVKLFLDGVLVCEEVVRTPSTQMRWVLQSTGVQGAAPAPGAVAHVLIDYVRVSAYAP